MVPMQPEIENTTPNFVHSIQVCMKGEYERWESGQFLFADGCGYSSGSPHAALDFISLEQAKDIVEKHSYYPEDAERVDIAFLECYSNVYNIYTFKQYSQGNSMMQFFHEEYQTPAGEWVVAFGRYGFEI